jgi:predicted small metal-binding protein
MILYPHLGAKEAAMAYVVTCPCGVIIRHDEVEEFVKEVQKHGKEVHNQDASREDILAMARRE